MGMTGAHIQRQAPQHVGPIHGHNHAVLLLHVSGDGGDGQLYRQVGRDVVEDQKQSRDGRFAAAAAPSSKVFADRQIHCRDEYFDHTIIQISAVAAQGQ